MTFCIGRREFITLLGGAAVTWPLAAHGQHAGKLPVVGFLDPTSSDAEADRLRAFRQGFITQAEEILVYHRSAS
jgi:putative ABC transport system substrate-binding protein